MCSFVRSDFMRFNLEMLCGGRWGTNGDVAKATLVISYGIPDEPCKVNPKLADVSCMPNATNATKVKTDVHLGRQCSAVRTLLRWYI